MNRTLKYFLNGLLVLMVVITPLFLIIHPPALAATTAGVTERVSISSSGGQGNGDSQYPAISGDGRFVAIDSLATNLVNGDTNGVFDVFVYDRQTRTNARVSISSTGEQGNGASFGQSISADGRYVVFSSWSSNLVSGDTNGYQDVFVHDRQTGETNLVSVASDGTQGDNYSYGGEISGDGRFVAFISAASNFDIGDIYGYENVYVRDLQMNTTERISIAADGGWGNGHSNYVTISSDGRYVAFHSFASNLVVGDNNGFDDVFIRDRQMGTTKIVSKSSGGTLGNGKSFYQSMSADGRYIAFTSEATNLVAGDTNNSRDIFVRDQVTGAVERISIASDGSQANLDSDTIWQSMSSDGRYVAFWSSASNLVSGDTNGVDDIFVHDRQTGETTRVSISSSGEQGNGISGDVYSSPSISADGRFVAFASAASNLVSGDTNGKWDVFVRDLCLDGSCSPSPTVTPTPTQTPSASTPTPTLIPSSNIDIALEAPIWVNNDQPPFLPNHLTLFAKAKNNSSISTARNVVIHFYDFDPNSGESLIGTADIGDLDPGASQKGSVVWVLPGNIENHLVYAVASFQDVANDPNPGNNTISRPISVYYTDFRHDRDAYNFSNSEVGPVSIDDIYQFFANYDTPNIFWNPLLPFIELLTEVNGHCYGMSDSSLVYYYFPSVKPDPSKTTYALTLDEARAKIRTYQWYVYGPMLEILMGLKTFKPSQQYQQTLASIRQGRPVIHGLMDFKGILPQKGSHAVVAYKIVDLGDEKRVFYYDNNLPLKAFKSGEVETYGVFTDKGFHEPVYSSLHPPYLFNEAFVIDAVPTASDLARILRDFVRWIFQFHFQSQTFSITTGGQADLLAIDSQGRRTGFISGQEVNEIPNAQVTGVENGQALILPSGLAYTFKITGVATSSLNPSGSSQVTSITIFDPISINQARLVEFQNIDISTGAEANISYAHGQQSIQISLPGGVIQPATTDLVIERPKSSLYIPLTIK